MNTESKTANYKKLGLVAIVALVMCWFIVNHKPPVKALPQLHITGSTMGTYFSVKLVAQQFEPEQQQQLQNEIEQLLEQVNNQMSTYRPDSELSLFNQSSANKPFKISAELAQVVSAAMQIGEQSDYRFDITVGPLVNLWGFGPTHRASHIPTDEQLQAILPTVGQQQLSFSANEDNTATLQKADAGLYLDLSSIAKGYGVDLIADYLSEKGFKNYLVDVGGELRVSGQNAQQHPWRVAVEKPIDGERSSQLVLALTDTAIATSGDYRNYFEQDGVRYSHTIDPVTARPIHHKLVSATVIHPQSMMADGYATAIMVLGPKAGLRFAKKLGLAVILISKTATGFDVEMTEQAKPYLL